MAAGLIEVVGNDVFCSIAGAPEEARFPLTEARPKLQGWAKRYDRASGRDDEGELAAIGREMFEWLDGSRWGSAWAASLGGDRELEIRATRGPRSLRADIAGSGEIAGHSSRR